MIVKEDAIVEITGWISEARDTLGIKTVRRTPSSPASTARRTMVAGVSVPSENTVWQCRSHPVRGGSSCHATAFLERVIEPS